MEYTQQVMDHFTNPRNMGDMEDASGVGTVGNAKCGDIMRIYIKVENDVIVDVKFKTFGCGAAIATSSRPTEMVKGNTTEEALTALAADLLEVGAKTVALLPFHRLAVGKYEAMGLQYPYRDTPPLPAEAVSRAAAHLSEFFTVYTEK